MPYPNLALAVVMQRTRLDNRWQSEKWEPIGVLPDSSEPGSAPRVLRQDSLNTQWLHPGFKLELFHDESEGYYLNLYSPQPYVFVNWLEEDGKGAVPVALVEAQARVGEGHGCTAACRTRNQDAPGHRPRGGAAGSKDGIATGRYAEGARLRVPGFLAPWSGREATPVRAEKAFSRSAFQRDGRARHVHRRLFQAGPDFGGDAEVAEASEPAALPRGSR